MDELDDDIDSAATAVVNAHLAVAILLGAEDEEAAIDHRTLPRRKKKKFKHEEALDCLQRDHLGPQPLFNDR
jgi:hypothetical protein